KTTRALYAETLINAGLLAQSTADEMTTNYRAALDRGEHVASRLVSEPDRSVFVDWSAYIGHDCTTSSNTGFDLKALQAVDNKMCEIPDRILVRKQVENIFEGRRKMAGGALPLNWGMAETLAYATLLEQGYPVRMTGQDVGRGTFSHRHAVIHSQKDGSAYVALAHMKAEQDRKSTRLNSSHVKIS